MIGITRSEFENSLMRQDVVEYYLAMSKDEIDYKFGKIISDMVDYIPNDPHHCYTVFEHVLRVVNDIPTGELSYEEIRMLKIAAFLHDVAKVNPDVRNEIESVNMAQAFLTELGYDTADIQRICFFIGHIDDFKYYKDEVPYYYEHHAIIKKISSRTIAEVLIANQYNFEKAGLDALQTKAVCHALVRDEEWPLFEDEKGNEVQIKPVDLQDLNTKLADIKNDYIPTYKDYKMLMKLSIANYKAQAKRTYQRGKLVATRQEKVRVAAIIEAILPEAYKLFKASMEKYQMDGALTQELLDATEEYNELMAMNQIEQMREQNAKNLMNKFNDMKIRLTMRK